VGGSSGRLKGHRRGAIYSAAHGRLVNASVTEAYVGQSLIAECTHSDQ
jgi:hypothetical protein